MIVMESYIDNDHDDRMKDLHKKWVIVAAKKGKHILCEKPAAISSDEVREMENACQENGVLFMEAFMYYFHPQHERV